MYSLRGWIGPTLDVVAVDDAATVVAVVCWVVSEYLAEIKFHDNNRSYVFWHNDSENSLSFFVYLYF